MKILITLLLLIATSGSFAQQQLNSYKYIIVPKQFDIFKEQNQYKSSTLIKFLLENKGFNVVYDDDLPRELSANRCLGLLVAMVNNSSMFTTKISLTFKDCDSKTVYKTAEGTSKKKEYNKSYDEAIRESLNGLNNFNYEYEGAPEPITVSFENDVENITPPVQNVVEQPVAKSAGMDIKKSVENKIVSDQVVQQVPMHNTEPSNVDYYAQSIENGYQLVDSTPKIVMKMLTTSKPNIYLGEDMSGNTGVVYAADGAWFFEYYQDGKLMLKTLKIKF